MLALHGLITSETSSCPCLPACLPTHSNMASVWHKDQEKVPAPWGWRRKQLRRHKLLILMFQEKEKRERTQRPERMTPYGFDVFVPQDGSNHGEYRIVRRRELRRWRWPGSIWGITWAVGSRFCLDRKSASHTAICIHQRTSKQGKGNTPGALILAGSGCRIFSVKGYCAKTWGCLVLMRPFPRISFVWTSSSNMILAYPFQSCYTFECLKWTYCLILKSSAFAVWSRFKSCLNLYLAGAMVGKLRYLWEPLFPIL